MTAQELAQKAWEIIGPTLDRETYFIPCNNDDCYKGHIIFYCDCMNDPKCSRCGGKGVIVQDCPDCKGKGEIEITVED